MKNMTTFHPNMLVSVPVAYVICLCIVVRGTGTETGTPLPVALSTESENGTRPTYTIAFLRKDNFDTKFSAGAVQYAINLINNDVERRWPFRLRFVTTSIYSGERDKPLQAITRYIVGDLGANITAFIGPDDACDVEARLAAAWNLPMIVYRCRDEIPTVDKEDYLTFARTIPSTFKIANFVISVMRHHNWKVCSLVVSQDPEWKKTAETFEKLAENHINISYVEPLDHPYIEDFGVITLKKILERTKDTTRIYLFFGEYDALIDFAREMHKMGLQSVPDHYVILSFFMGSNRNNLVAKWNDKNRHVVREEWANAFRNVLLLMPRKVSNPRYNHFLDMSVNYSIQIFNAPPVPAVVRLKPPVYAAYLYDAVHVFARALAEVLRDGGSADSGRDIVSRIRGRDYQSILGHFMHIDGDGDCVDNYTLMALEDGQFQTVASFSSNNDNRSTEELTYHQMRDIQWIDGRLPLSEPVCGFDGHKCRFKPDWSVGVICIVVALLIPIGVVFACRHYRYEHKLARLVWKLDFKELLMADPEAEPSHSDKLKVKGMGTIADPKDPCTTYVVFKVKKNKVRTVSESTQEFDIRSSDEDSEDVKVAAYVT